MGRRTKQDRCAPPYDGDLCVHRIEERWAGKHAIDEDRGAAGLDVKMNSRSWSFRRGHRFRIRAPYSAGA